ncbi:hypothetical protein CLM84_07205, partial [Streptomyces albidoflavus]
MVAACEPQAVAPAARAAVTARASSVRGRGVVIGDGRGRAGDFDGALAIARDGGLLAAPPGGARSGPGSIRSCLDELDAARIGALRPPRLREAPRLLGLGAARQITCEVCPASNVALGVY